MRTARSLHLLAFLFLFSAIIYTQAQTRPARFTKDLSENTKRSFDTEIDTSNWPLTNKFNTLKLKFIVGEEQPAKIAYRAGQGKPPSPNLDAPVWIPVDPSKRELDIDLGSGEGEFYFQFGASWDHPFVAMFHGEGTTVDRTPPIIVITYPTNRITSQPWLQLLGYANEKLSGIHYDIANSTGKSLNQNGFVTDQDFDHGKFDFTTNYFHCYDIALALGTNLITLRCSDRAGKESTTNVEIIFSTAGDTTPPVITPRWPTNEMTISGSTFTARGTLDDYTASLKGIISHAGQTNEFNGLVERNGTYWVEGIPILDGTNVLTIIATDAAGNSSRTNLTLTKSDVDFEIETTPKGDDLYQPSGVVTGHVTPGFEVYINGTKAVVEPDGHWRAEKVPIYGMGTATFDATAVPSEAAWAAKNTAAGIKNLLTSAVELKQDPIVLNQTQSACGNFAIRLSGTYKKNFVLMASTNLSDWTPILTNFNSAATYDFTDTNGANYQCRFFRVVPLPASAQ